MTPTPATDDDRSLRELFSVATRESSDLILKEIELAKLEIAENLSGLKWSAAGMTVGPAFLFAGLLVLLGAAVLAIDQVLQQPCLSALLVGTAVTVTGAVATVAGRVVLKHADITPQRSAASLHEDEQMLEQHLGSRGIDRR